MNSPARPPLLPLDAALGQLLVAVTPLTETQTVPTMEADGRVLAQDVVSGLQVPAHDNSSMDGYAVRTGDVPAPGATLHVTQRIPAGSVGTALAARARSPHLYRRARSAGGRRHGHARGLQRGRALRRDQRARAGCAALWASGFAVPVKT